MKHPKLIELLAIFITGNVPLETQGKLLIFMKSLTPDVVQLLPNSGISLLPLQIPYIQRPLDPGTFCYFGIKNILDTTGLTLFDKESNIVRLTIFIDETPLFKSQDDGNLWPLLGSCEKYPVFLIGMYQGRGKPTCSNLFIRELVFEIKQLCTNGLLVDGRMYQFRLHRMVMDAPAMSYIIGVKNHSGYSCCKRCTTEGSLVFIGYNKKGRVMNKVRFLESDAILRQHQDFLSFFNAHTDPHETTSSVPSDEFDSSTMPSGPTESEKVPKKRGRNSKKKDKKKTYHQHPTVLVTIPHFNLVRDIILDYMHLICLGVVKALIFRWIVSGSLFKMADNVRLIVNKRLLNARKYCPAEFQRKPNSFRKISNWKATSYRMFVLYIGVVVLHGVLDSRHVKHFHLLVAATRCMCRRLRTKGEERQRIITTVASTCRHLLREFVRQGIELYSEKFVVYNTHSLLHVPDDYERFGPLDESSAYKYESFLGRLKRMVTANFKPMIQIINKYSSLLYTRQFGQAGNRGTDITEEYYEILALRESVYDESKKLPINVILAEKEDTTKYDETRYHCFEQMQFKNFLLRSDTYGDQHCLIGTNTFMKIRKVLQDKDSGEILLAGNVYEEVRPLFETSTLQIPSTEFGINLCSKLSSTLSIVTLDKLNEKCFALPLHPETAGQGGHVDEWVLIRYLH